MVKLQQQIQLLALKYHKTYMQIILKLTGGQVPIIVRLRDIWTEDLKLVKDG
jgi:hypothetical protein